MRKYLITTLALMGLSAGVYAGDNSQATLGDIKEATYLLILKNKELVEDIKILKLKIAKDAEVLSAKTSNDTNITRYSIFKNEERINKLEMMIKKEIQIADDDNISSNIKDFVKRNNNLSVVTQKIDRR